MFGHSPLYLFVLALSVVLAAYILLGAFATFVSDSLIFPTPPSSYKDNEKIIKLRLPSEETISAIYLPNADARYTIIYSHGNNEDIGTMMPDIVELRTRGYSVISYDYPGYGTSTGAPSESKCYESIEAVYQHLVNKLHTPPHRIILYGRSLGSGPTTDLASKVQVAGVIYEGAFSSAFRVMTWKNILPWDKFDNLSKIKAINSPALFIHGKQDGIVALWHGKKLHKHAKHPKMFYWVDDAGHNDIVEVGAGDYWQAIHDFTKSLP